MRIEPEGLHLTDSSGQTEYIPTPYEVEALASKTIALADAQADPLVLFVNAESDVPEGVFMNVLAALSDET